MGERKRQRLWRRRRWKREKRRIQYGEISKKSPAMKG
jgi:hypothetical protein